jgi:serine/threonine-protein kinase HipA
VSTFNAFYQCIDGTVLKCARIQLVENDRGLLEKVYFTYHPDFLASSQYPIDPQLLPKSSTVVELNCHKEAPGFIDDVQPDDWGKKVLARLHHLPNPTIAQLMSVMDYSTVGALHFMPIEQPENPQYGLGCAKQEVGELQSIADKIDSGTATSKEIERIKLNMFARGSSVGGARPKVLVYENNQAYIAKFGRATDPFDYATVEHACLTLMRKAGLNVTNSHVESIHQRNVLFVERFDISPQGGRYHQITANALLKNQATQTDAYTASYNQLSKLIAKYSVHPERDQQQLFGQMLFNRALSNTDDHLRNFSFSCRENGWQLSPAYDVVPSTTFGQYHQLRVGYSDVLPTIATADKVHDSFHLTQQQAQQVCATVGAVMQQWQAIFQQCGVSDKDIAVLEKVIEVD